MVTIAFRVLVRELQVQLEDFYCHFFKCNEIAEQLFLQITTRESREPLRPCVLPSKTFIQHLKYSVPE